MGDMKTSTERDWAGRTISKDPITYINKTGQDTQIAHKAIMAAIANNGVFCEDFADIFTLTRPSGVWILDFV